MLPPVSPYFSRCFLSGLHRHIQCGGRTLPRSLPALLLFSLLTTTVFAAPPLTADTALAREGYFVLRWSVEENPGARLILQQSANPDFAEFTAANGEPTSIDQWDVSNAVQFTQSGLDNGDYYYRLTDDFGVSNTVQVTVEHHSLVRALMFFSMGLLLFLILVAMIIVGHRRTVHP